MLSDNKGRRINNYVPDYVVFDLETTGISSTCDAVVEISAIKVVDGCVVDEFTSLVNPGMHIPYYASEVNGITDEMVKDCPSFDVVLSSFFNFIGDDVLVGHNIHSFDLKFIWRDALKYFGKTIDNNYIDTLLLSRVYLPGMSHALVDLAAHYGIESNGAHRALNDCKMNQQVFEKLVEEMKDSPLEIRTCSICGCFLKKREGRFGEFWGCTNYPNCHYTEDN